MRKAGRTKYLDLLFWCDLLVRNSKYLETNDSNEVAMARLGPILGQNEATPSRIISIALTCRFLAI